MNCPDWTSYRGGRMCGRASIGCRTLGGCCCFNSAPEARERFGRYPVPAPMPTRWADSCAVPRRTYLGWVCRSFLGQACWKRCWSGSCPANAWRSCRGWSTVTSIAGLSFTCWPVAVEDTPCDWWPGARGAGSIALGSGRAASLRGGEVFWPPCTTAYRTGRSRPSKSEQDSWSHWIIKPWTRHGNEYSGNAAPLALLPEPGTASE